MVTATFGRHVLNNILVYLLPIRTVPALNNVIVGIFYFIGKVILLLGDLIL